MLVENILIPLLYVIREYINQNFLIDTKFNLAVKFLSNGVSPVEFTVRQDFCTHSTKSSVTVLVSVKVFEAGKNFLIISVLYTQIN